MARTFRALDEAFGAPAAAVEALHLATADAAPQQRRNKLITVRLDAASQCERDDYDDRAND